MAYHGSLSQSKLSLALQLLPPRSIQSLPAGSQDLTAHTGRGRDLDCALYSQNIDAGYPMRMDSPLISRRREIYKSVIDCAAVTKGDAYCT